MDHGKPLLGIPGNPGKFPGRVWLKRRFRVDFGWWVWTFGDLPFSASFPAYLKIGEQLADAGRIDSEPTLIMGCSHAIGRIVVAVILVITAALVQRMGWVSSCVLLFSERTSGRG